jgi:hypothetical protein
LLESVASICDNPHMHVLGRATLAGAVVGLVETFIQLHDPHHGLMFFAPFLVGLLLNWAMGVPRWGGVAVLAPFVNIVLLFAGFWHLAPAEVMDLGVWQGSALFMMVGASGNLVAAALVGPGATALRTAVAGAVAVAFIGVGAHQGTMDETAQVRRLDASGVPLIAATVPGYELTAIFEQFQYAEEPPSIQLRYERYSDRSDLQIDVMRPTAATVEAACREYVPDVTMLLGACRKVSDHVWVREEGLYTRVFALSGAAPVQLASETMPENELIALTGRLRPVTAAELAALDDA